MNEGFRIYEINEKTKIPKEIKSGSMKDSEDFNEILSNLDVDNKTYAIRIGKEGLK